MLKINNHNELLDELFSMQDNEYRRFHSGLMPTVPYEKIIGIPVPKLRKFAKSFAKFEYSKTFLNSLPHKYYEEDNLHGFLIEQITDFQSATKALDEFLPYVDNWATCDIVNPKVLGQHKEKLIIYVEKWINGKGIYEIRFGIGMLMRHFLDENFKKEYLDLICNIKSCEYYINMMRGWFFATALAKKYDDTIEILEDKRLDVFTHNKTIQKAIESNRISAEQKKYLRTLRIK